MRSSRFFAALVVVVVLALCASAQVVLQSGPAAKPSYQRSGTGGGVAPPLSHCPHP